VSPSGPRRQIPSQAQAKLPARLKTSWLVADTDDVISETNYQELCCHCTSVAIGYFKRPTKYKGESSTVSWLCRVHIQVYPLDRVVLTRVAGRPRAGEQAGREGSPRDVPTDDRDRHP